MADMRQSMAAIMRKPAGAILLIALWLSLFPAALQASSFADDRGAVASGGTSSLMQLIASEAASPGREAVASKDPLSSPGGPDEAFVADLRNVSFDPGPTLAARYPRAHSLRAPAFPHARRFRARAPPHA
jgi:hypothetical protein